ncbi:hypothetical protein Kpol_1064p21 [Vanderwaltozyma polyspora DSM 70294]|uniref:Uncharacterized protein n=1 Tax=Vanderwaltozyma polyspora (strain ATCC 22028 / DSM 70294 / BCRC 21397 / CBS 2163 / NBRC 10782 / NRRL Y-8283 / UCD 57-17) TaxID=436907 RepID=A7TME6_VANPO|nr:uncharacterized protein Kpol_1064p21 [Vanderwaltozyma polyspora DSM 70294]EDO16540.1 hypothetical protein Kpol_1064p21 [Vanderwaltozyma polyspora DSM 70294]
MWKRALAPYIKDPIQYSKDEVVFFDEKVVIITDKFAKSEYHLLVLPRNPFLTKEHPTIALQESVKDKLDKYIAIAQDHIYKSYSDKYSLLVGSKWFKDDEEYRNKEKFITEFINVGVHSVPSMSNLHIHVITKDFHSSKMKHKKHYNSFNTEFFVNWDKLPLKEIPDASYMEKEVIAKSDLICSYCSKNFKNKFSLLKQHLDEEFNTHFKSLND